MKHLQKIISTQNNIISDKNPEWMQMVNLSKNVQNDFNNFGHLTMATFEAILLWNQPQRKTLVNKILNNASESILESITHCYAQIIHPDEDMETRIKAGILLSIPWIGIKNTSAIMSFHQPLEYGIIDSRSWYTLFRQHKKSFNGNDYLSYLSTIRTLAVQNECSVQEIDFILRYTSIDSF